MRVGLRSWSRGSGSSLRFRSGLCWGLFCALGCLCRINIANRSSFCRWRYRGRGYLQLTGQANYVRLGSALGIDLDADPDLARVPKVAWKIAAHYFANTHDMAKRNIWTVIDETDSVVEVTRMVNGGLNGLADRMDRTDRALAVLMDTWPENGETDENLTA